MRKRGLFEKFDENKCRVCSDIFCCKQCREKHEKSKHNDISLICDICLYGTIKASAISEILIDHIKSIHWPLHCLCCSRVFSTVEELFQNNKCPVVRFIPRKLEQSSHSPPVIHTYNGSTYFPSPPDQLPFEKNKKSTLATSTPMQRNTENDLKKIQEVITPVDSPGSITNSILKKTHLESDHSDLPKRRVTFSTPFTDNENNTSENEENTSPKETTTNSLSNSSLTAYYTAQDYCQTIMDKLSNDVSSIYKSTPKLQGTKKHETEIQTEKKIEVVLEENKTVWISAINASLSHDIKEPLVNELHTFVTPMAKKKQLNLLMPLTMIEEIRKCSGAIQISSTPNSSIIPIQSVPTAKDIFRIGEPKLLTINDTTSLTKENEDSREQSGDSSSTGSNFLKKISTIMKNFASSFQNISSIESITSNDKSLKRYASDNELFENPPAKRYKLTDIKCRPSIRGLPRPREDASGEIRINIVSNTISKTNIISTNIITSASNKTYADKSTQTDDYLCNGNFFTNLFRQH